MRVTQVLDVGQVVAGNFCGAILGYFGADVIKANMSPFLYTSLQVGHTNTIFPSATSHIHADLLVLSALRWSHQVGEMRSAPCG